MEETKTKMKAVHKKSQRWGKQCPENKESRLPPLWNSFQLAEELTPS